MNTCDCSRPTKNYLCDNCTTKLAEDLGRVPGMLKELSTTAARLDAVKIGTSIESKSVSASEPDPVNFAATLCADELRDHVGALVRDDAPAIATKHWAPAFKRKLTRLLARAMTIIDSEPERHHLGACPTEGCGEPMNPVRGAQTHHCWKCGQTIDIAEHQGRKLGAAWAVTARPPQLVPVLAALGVRVTTKNIKNWKLLGHLQPAGEQDGHPTYTVAAVYDVANRMAARRKKTA